jgi:cell division cycle 2-like protein
MSKRGRWDSSSDEESKEPKATLKRSSNSTATEKQPQPPDHFTLHNPLLKGCRSVYSSYEQISHVSEGTFGIVWKARDLSCSSASDPDHAIVALKQIKFHNEKQTEGFPVAALREITCLLDVSHENVVSVREMVVGDGFDKVFMVMDYFEFDLKEGLDRFEGALFQSELKSILLQILSAVAYTHSRWYLHRDIKTSNILVHASGRIALADFGLARRYETPQTRALTVLVCTLWYRAPELLFGEDKYSAKVDMWSVGCVFAELIAKSPLFEGQGELDQIDQIFELVGTPDSNSWPDFEQLPNAGLLRWKARKPEDIMLPKRFPVGVAVKSNHCFLDSQGYNLLAKLSCLDPSRRISAKDALEHSYFKQGVKPKTPRFFTAG